MRDLQTRYPEEPATTSKKAFQSIDPDKKQEQFRDDKAGPAAPLYMIRYHSCYPIHREGAYKYLMNDHDREMFRWVRAFNPYDLNSKSHEPPNVKALKPCCEDLIAEYVSKQITW